MGRKVSDVKVGIFWSNTMVDSRETCCFIIIYFVNNKLMVKLLFSSIKAYIIYIIIIRLLCLTQMTHQIKTSALVGLIKFA